MVTSNLTVTKGASIVVTRTDITAED